jgi:asparagine synthase (glutamine-hydrolysing)
VCGINGIFAYQAAAGSPSKGELLATREAMRARGPDGMGAWWSADRRFGVAHRRLAIIDLSERAAQPMVSNDGNLVISFNGEIYNFPELRAELEVKGVRFRTDSDTELLLHLFARDGERMLSHLRGMFALAIWNERERRLFLARDPYGIKPLYTADDGWTFRFASQVKALLAGGGISRDPEPAGVVGYHLFGSVPEPFTLYRRIRSLPAGHWQWIDAAGPREPVRFAHLAAVLAAGAALREPAPPLHDRLPDALRDSVRAHLLADVDVGLFLSGGVDSGALLGLMAEAAGRNVCAITLAFDEFRDSGEDEVPAAAQVAKRYSARHVVRRVGEREFRADVPAIIEAMDQPSIDGVNTWFAAKAAKENGLKVALSGLGGDELLAGYPSFVDVPRWHRCFGPAARLPGFGATVRALALRLAPGISGKRPKALGMLEYAGSWEGAYLLRRALFLPSELSQMLDPAMVREGLRRLKPLQRLRAALTPDPGSDAARVCALESAHYLRNQLLRDADWAGMAHGIEIRVPLVDFRLLRDLAPSMRSLRPGSGKRALADAPTIALPDEVVERAKTGFGVPIGAWLENRAAGPRLPTLTKGAASRRWSRQVLAAMLPGAA